MAVNMQATDAPTVAGKGNGVGPQQIGNGAHVAGTREIKMIFIQIVVPSKVKQEMRVAFTEVDNSCVSASWRPANSNGEDNFLAVDVRAYDAL